MYEMYLEPWQTLTFIKSPSLSAFRFSSLRFRDSGMIARPDVTTETFALALWLIVIVIFYSGTLDHNLILWVMFIHSLPQSQNRKTESTENTILAWVSLRLISATSVHLTWSFVVAKNMFDLWLQHEWT